MWLHQPTVLKVGNDFDLILVRSNKRRRKKWRWNLEVCVVVQSLTQEYPNKKTLAPWAFCGLEKIQQAQTTWLQSSSHSDLRVVASNKILYRSETIYSTLIKKFISQVQLRTYFFYPDENTAKIKAQTLGTWILSDTFEFLRRCFS